MSTTFNRERKVAGWILSAPLLILLAGLLVWPIYLGFQTSITHDVLSEFETYPVGFENYRSILSEPNFWSSIRFTLIFALTATIIELILGFALALLFDRYFPGKRILFSLMLVPIMIAPSLMAVMFRLILNENIGVIPGLLNKIGLSYSIFDQKYYTDVSKGIVADNAQLLSKDAFTLAEYANRLNHINNSMINVLMPNIERQHKRAVELLSILKKEYKLNEDSELND